MCIRDRYGISKKGVDYAAETGVGLIIVLDCGIKAVEEITYAKEKGIDFIICDHHVPDDILPPAVAILNAKRPDNTYPYTHLSGCGVGFKFMQAFAISNGIEFHHLIPLLDLVAVSIASDIVPIMGENRILAFHGLKQLNSNPSVGMKAIIDVCGLSEREITVSDIVFKIGPRINASGRIQNGKEDIKNINPSFLEKLKSSAQRITLQIVQKPEEKIVINAIQPAVAGDDYSIIYEDPKGDHSVGIYEKFTHKWRIKNTGTIPWENRYLTLQNKGEIRVKAIQDQFDIPALKPGDTAVVNLSLIHI